MAMGRMSCLVNIQNPISRNELLLYVLNIEEWTGNVMRSQTIEGETRERRDLNNFPTIESYPRPFTKNFSVM